MSTLSQLKKKFKSHSHITLSPTLSHMVNAHSFFNTNVSSSREADPRSWPFPPLSPYCALPIIALAALIKHYSDYWFTYPFPPPNDKQFGGQGHCFTHLCNPQSWCLVKTQERLDQWKFWLLRELFGQKGGHREAPTLDLEI